MKLLQTMVLLSALPFATSFAAQGVQQGAQQGAGNPSGETKSVARKTVKPGDRCHTNTDGVEVCNTGSDGNITINPQSGNGNSATTVKFKNNAEGTVTGIDSNDTVKVADGAYATISGTGGTVAPGSGSAGKITNTSAVGSGSNITITGGPVPIYVGPGQTVTFGDQP